MKIFYPDIMVLYVQADGNMYVNAGYGTGRYDNKWAGTPGADMNGRVRYVGLF